MAERYAVLKDFKVVNIIKANEPLPGTVLIKDRAVNIGWGYKDGAFIPPVVPISEKSWNELGFIDRLKKSFIK